ncbi:oligoendopeptidase F [Deinococcus psychrotolerans]|uniref:Oligoendopeptidase F n=1 Tax=Deinococcus psychrotolerans TaxID=2489213 RepID=A0A3G8YPQ1_9DEIO|nr:M3 family oligoendopeptidase [Deinococcus psychrotolerans]AZI43156.1 oligoendopeptidase F [Deinococcus psychrotolerans]
MPDNRVPDSQFLILTAEQQRWATYAPRMEALMQANLTPAGAASWLADWSELSKEIAQVGAVLSLRADLNTADFEAQRALSAFQEELGPPLGRAEQALRQKLLALEGYQPAPDFALTYRRMRDESAFYREANLELSVVHAAQMQRHAEITGGQTVEFGDSELTVPEAESLLGSADRLRREQVWQAMARSRAEMKPALDGLLLELLTTRRQLALNADLKRPDGLDDYRAYRWQELDRVDYTPQDCLDFHAAILSEVVPLSAAIMDSKREQLGLESLRPWDYSRRTALDAQGRPPLTPFKSAAELEGIAERVFDALDPALGAQFGQMRGELLDLASRPNKMSHAYCSSLQASGVPFVVMNVVGTANDLKVLLHEMGHAFHFFASARAQPLIWNRWSPLEFIEVPSMAMEFLALGELQAAYLPADLERVRREQLESSILFLPWAAQMDAFQHWLYSETGPQVSIAELDAKWLELDRAFHPWLDWSDLNEAERASGWQYYHIFRAPFYYLEYAMCSLGALGIWRASQHDRAAALQRYKEALSLGNTVSVPELYKAAGLEFRFDRAYLAEMMDFVQKQ